MMTGGTISTTVNERGHLDANGKKTVSLLAEHFLQGRDADVEFEYCHPLDILSENMTFPRLNLLLDAFRGLDQSKYGAIIVAHGTDTLAYTSSLLALALAGWLTVPLFMVSSDRTLTDHSANGHDNFRAACELAIDGFGPGVYVPYRNSDGVIYLHRGAHLRQCDNFTADFYSADMMPYCKAEPYSVQAEHPILMQLDRFTESVLRIEPYVGIDYSVYRLDGIKAVLHGSYHSSTACVERRNAGEPYSKRSALYLTDKCRKQGTDIFLSPLTADMRATLGTYSTTAELIAHGMKPIFSLTNETAYIKLTLAYCLGYEGEEIIPFMEREVASERLPL